MSESDFARAQAAHRAGDFAAAEGPYRSRLSLAPDDVEALYAYGVLLAQTRRVDESLIRLEHAARLAPADPRIGRNLALVLQAAGRTAEAEAQFRRLIGLVPGEPAFRFGLGLLLHSLGRLDECIAAFREGLTLAPGDAEAHCNLGLACMAGGRWDEAADAFARAAELAPGLAKAHGNLGGARFAAGKWEEALAAWTRAAALGPLPPSVQADRGVALAHLGRPAEAAECFRRAAELEPEEAGHLYNLGRALHDLGRVDEAADAYLRVLALNEGHASAHVNLGALLRKAGRADSALEHYDRALALTTPTAELHLNRAKALADLRRMAEALESCRAALALNPDSGEALCEAVHLRRHLCDWDGLEAEEAALCTLVRSGGDGVDPFVFLAVSADPAEHAACARLWAEDLVRRNGGGEGGAPSFSSPGGRIRLGYLSADFRRHPVAHLISEVFERHDRERFTVHAYACGPEEDCAERRRIAAGVDAFTDLRLPDGAEAAERIRADGIDILVDLTGYTRYGRTDILVRRPAPVQVNYLGYAGTLGGGFADYILADPTILPMAEQPHAAERIVHLPDSYLPWDSGRAFPASFPDRSECGLPEEGFVFGAFHNLYKITPTFFALWLDLLRQVPGSVLWLLQGAAGGEDALRRRAEAAGVDPRRLVFAPRVEIGLYLARHRHVDLFLDTLPYNAHGSAADALWMGAPVLTCRGSAFPGRVAAGVLRAAGMTELVAESPEDYAARALDIARRPGRAAQLRRRLEEGRASCPLFDGARFTANLERAYERMAERARAGLPPESFSL